MKKRSLISLFVLIISVMSCYFIFAEKKIASAYAAVSETECYSLLGQDGELYSAKHAVGSVSGQGEYIVGDENVELKATAYDNYYLRGWKITYTDQSNRVQIVDTEGLNGGVKTVTLTAADGLVVEATASFVLKDNLFNGSTFKLNTVFK